MPTRSHSLAVLPGDGVGPEVTAAALEVLDAAQQRFGFTTERTVVPLGAEHYLETGELLTEDTVAQLREHDAILFGAIGSPKVRPGILERGIILALRGAMRQAVNCARPALTPRPDPDRRSGAAALRPGHRAGEHRGAYVAQGSTVHRGTPARTAVQESVNTWYAVERAVEFAYRLGLGAARAAHAVPQDQRAGRGRVAVARRLASVRRGRLTLCHKTNVLVEAGSLWLDVMEEVGSASPTWRPTTSTSTRCACTCR
ncbi:hypothetical protein BJF82_14510 [Kytococcus sp. CUA-901]|nr:hypothetical protein BJF82_14510 [Kytococcus sp. CUA-901]